MIEQDAIEQDGWMGSDGAKDWLDGASTSEERGWRVGNDGDGMAAVVTDLGARAPHLVVLEATGG